MASRSSIAARQAVARERLHGAMVRLSEKTGAPLPPPPTVPIRQPELKAVFEIEGLATFLEGFESSVPEKEGPGAEAVESGEPDEAPDDRDEDHDDGPLFAGLPLSDFDGKSDEEILAVEHVGKATLKRIRAAQRKAE